jgi:hypothetical protein
MFERKKISERRKNRRYKAVEGAYAAISPNSNKLGQIADISMSGLCFKYIDTGDGYQNIETRQNESIFLSSLGHYVGDLAFKTVSDYEVTDTPLLSSLKIRKRHIQFANLTSTQLFDIDNYLRNNISEQVETPF